MASTSGIAEQVNSPATTTVPAVAMTSQAQRRSLEPLSALMISSRTSSAIWSQTLSGPLRH